MMDLNNHSIDKISLSVKFNINLVNSDIKHKGVFKSGSTEIKYNLKDSDIIDPKMFYTAKICIEDNTLFIGTLSKELIRNGNGINFYCSDVYLGSWKDDKRDDTGIYIYRSKESNINEVFYGKWSLGKKNGFGVYVWKQGAYPGLMDMFIGEFSDDKISKGLHISGISKKGFPKSYYYGKFNKDGLKEDSEAFLYSTQTDIIYFGQLEQGEFIEGTIYKKENNSELLYNIIKSNSEEEYVPISDNIDDQIKKKIKNIYSKFNGLDKDLISNLAEYIISELPKEIIKMKSYENLNVLKLDDNKCMDECKKLYGEINENNKKLTTTISRNTTNRSQVNTTIRF